MSPDHADAAEAFRRRHPETFARYLARRRMVFLVAYVGYVCAYLVRNNFKLTSEALRLAHGWTLTEVGLVLTAFTVTYGFGKFIMGMVVDRTSLRKTFALALGLSSCLCIALGFISTLPVLFATMLLLGLIQGALAPASMTMIANWYPNKTRGAGIAIWNTSQNLGGAGLPLIITGLLSWTGPANLAAAFWVPGAVVLGLSFLFWRIGGDRPEVEQCGTLDDIYGEAGSPQASGDLMTPYWTMIRREVFTSRVILTLAAINAMLYFLRFGILNWMPAFLGTEMGFTRAEYSMAFSTLEWVAIPGSFLFAWLSAVLPNRQSIVGCLGLVVLAGLVVFYLGNHSYPLLLVCSGLMGMLVYGPQLIVNVLTLNLVPLRAAGVAVGFVGLGGYLVGELSANLVMPLIAERFNWTASLLFVSGIAAATGLLYLSLRTYEAKTVRVGSSQFHQPKE